jgi:hypothetical protein
VFRSTSSIDEAKKEGEAWLRPYEYKKMPGEAWLRPYKYGGPFEMLYAPLLLPELRESDHLADGGGAGEQHQQPVDADA